MTISIWRLSSCQKSDSEPKSSQIMMRRALTFFCIYFVFVLADVSTWRWLYFWQNMFISWLVISGWHFDRMPRFRTNSKNEFSGGNVSVMLIFWVDLSHYEYLKSHMSNIRESKKKLQGTWVKHINLIIWSSMISFNVSQHTVQALPFFILEIYVLNIDSNL